MRTCQKGMEPMTNSTVKIMTNGMVQTPLDMV